MVFDSSVLKITTVDFRKDLQSHTILIENQFTEQPVIFLRSFRRFVCSMHSWKSTSVEIIG